MVLQGKTALITGANRGIGAAIAAALVETGATVLGGVRALDDEHTTPDGVQRVELDLSTPESVDRCASALLAEGPRIDVLINSAGRFGGGLFERQAAGTVQELLWVNLGASIELTRRFLPGMIERGGGTVVNNASIVGRAPFPGAAVYAASKSGVGTFSESLRREIADTSVGVLELVTPGTDTEMMEQVQRELGDHVDTSGWDHVDPGDWADKVVEAIESDEDRLDPGGAERLAELLPPKLLGLVSRQAFDR